MSDLLPCPFCGGEARVWQDPCHSKAFFIGCDDGETDCFGAVQWAETEPEAIAAWNRRAIPAVQPTASPEVQALVKAVSAEIEARNLFLSTAPDRGGSHGPKGQRKMALENAQLATVFALAAFEKEGK